MIGEIFSLFLNAPKVVRIKVYPYFNRLLINNSSLKFEYMATRP